MVLFLWQILCSLHVEKLIIPAIPDLLETWTRSFSFKPLEPSHREEIKNLSLMVFAETTLLQKSIHRTSTLVQEGIYLSVSSYFTLCMVKWLLLSGAHIYTFHEIDVPVSLLGVSFLCRC